MPPSLDRGAARANTSKIMDALKVRFTPDDHARWLSFFQGYPAKVAEIPTDRLHPFSSSSIVPCLLQIPSYPAKEAEIPTDRLHPFSSSSILLCLLQIPSEFALDEHRQRMKGAHRQLAVQLRMASSSTEADMEEALRTEQTQKHDETAPEIDEVELPSLDRGVRFDVGEEDEDNEPFEEEGPARSRKDLEAIGLDFSKKYDTGATDQPRLEGNKPQNAEARLAPDDRSPHQHRHEPAAEKGALSDCHQVHTRSKSRSGKAGEGGAHRTRLQPLVTNDLKEETQGEEIKLKIVVDFRKLKAAAIVVFGQLDDQDNILKAFHGKHYVSLCDAAGGFYRFRIQPDDQHKTCFVLPTSCGGTTFICKVAPYGLTDMPAIYSRAMMHVLQGLQDVDLAHKLR
eukprot:6199793-Pleurochrysis_carterae.AAC.2